MRAVATHLLLASVLLCARPDRAMADGNTTEWLAMLRRQRLETELLSQVIPTHVLAQLRRWQPGLGFAAPVPGSAAQSLPAVTVLHLFATWCKPCEAELPSLLTTWQGLISRLPGSADKPQMIFLLQDDDLATLADWQKKNPALGEQVPLRSDFQGALKSRIVRMCDADDLPLPTTMILDRCGVTRQVFVGSLEGRFSAFSRAVNRLLAIRDQVRCTSQPPRGERP